MDVTGTIKRISATEQVSDKFKKRNFVISTTGEYPQLIEFQVTQDKCSLLDKVKKDQQVTVHFNLRGREWTSPKGDVKYFNTLEVWRIETGDGNKKPAHDDYGATLLTDDSLPF